jgi:hypothetical protein
MICLTGEEIKVLYFARGGKKEITGDKMKNKKFLFSKSRQKWARN